MIATMAYLGEQVPDFGNAFGPPRRSSRTSEIRRGGSSWRHCVAVRQIDATDPLFDPSATKTELVGDLPGRNCPLQKEPRSRRIAVAGELGTPTAHQARLRDSVRSTILDCAKSGNVSSTTSVRIDVRLPNRAPHSRQAVAQWSRGSSAADENDQRPASPAARPFTRGLPHRRPARSRLITSTSG